LADDPGFTGAPRTFQRDFQAVNALFSVPVIAVITLPFKPNGSGPLTNVSVPEITPHSALVGGLEATNCEQDGNVAPNVALAARNRHNPTSNFIKKDVFVATNSLSRGRSGRPIVQTINPNNNPDYASVKD
jgi:hypothetical protein